MKYGVILSYFIIIILGISLFIKYKKSVVHSKINLVLKDILKLSLQQKEDVSIIDTLKKVYDIDYCTLFVYTEGKYKVLNSNVSFLYFNDLESHVNKKMRSIDSDAEVNISKNGLTYKGALKREIKYSYFTPLSANGEIIGAIFIENTRVNFKYDKEILIVILEAITLILQNFLYYKKISDMALKDQLTQVYNRNFMNEHLNEQIKSKKKFTIIIGDIDHFKKVNDTYGHQTGDTVLKFVAAAIKDFIGEDNYIYRYGGEEFVICLENKTEEESSKFIDKLREQIASASIKTETNDIKVSMSFGCYQPTKDDSIEKMLGEADKALYFSKESGRNRVTMHKQLLEHKSDSQENQSFFIKKE